MNFKKKILVTGGAGYIGSHTIIELLANTDFDVLSVDDYSNSSAKTFERIEKITGKCMKNYAIDLCNKDAVNNIFLENKDIIAVVHFAAFKSVPESVADPLKYYHNNIASLVNILSCLKTFNVPHLIFSSSCSVYGNIKKLPVKEDTPLGKAESPYGYTKQIGEKMIEDFVNTNPAINAIALRYFNPVGAHLSGRIGELPLNAPNNLVPVITGTAIGKIKELTVFGGDYPTRDGTCIRDYVHVSDIANAHILAVNFLLQKKNDSNYMVFNLGTGKGISVLEAIQSFEKVSGVKLKYRIGERRDGDVIEIFSDTYKVLTMLGWKPVYNLDEMMASAWKWELNLKQRASDGGRGGRNIGLLNFKQQMNVKFIGAARTVTGSKHLITTNKGKQLLLDCGLFQNKGSDNDKLNRHFGFDPSSINYLILSHAHIDHSGNIPNLVKQGFKGKIFCTSATFDLCKIMLADSAHIHENDIAYINIKRTEQGLKLLKPLYTIQDVEQCLTQFQVVELNKPFQLDEEIEFLFTGVGHILGSAAVNLTINENGSKTKLCFTGDIGRPNDLILKAPDPFPQADYIICESTYGNRLHESNLDAEKKLLQIVVETCIVKKGKLIIPAFSLGRTQEIVYSLDRMKNKKLLPPIKVFVDSPLSTNATNIMRKHPECFNKDIIKYMEEDADPFGFSNLIYTQNVEESKALNYLKEPCIIISASGMMEAGRIKHHLKNNITRSENTVLIVGYCPPESLGGKLLAGEQKVNIYGREYKVKATIEVINSYSAHADYNEMINYLSCQEKSKVKKIFLVHGVYDAQTAFKEKLILSGFQNVEIPEEGESHSLFSH